MQRIGRAAVVNGSVSALRVGFFVVLGTNAPGVGFTKGCFKVEQAILGHDAPVVEGGAGAIKGLVRVEVAAAGFGQQSAEPLPLPFGQLLDDRGNLLKPVFEFLTRHLFPPQEVYDVPDGVGLDRYPILGGGIPGMAADTSPDRESEEFQHLNAGAAGFSATAGPN